MSKIKKKQAQHRAEIIEAAIPIIAKVSFDDISIADICNQIGISVGSFYHYFNKKSDLLIGLLWRIDEDLEQRVFPLLTSEDELENLRIFAHGWAEHVDTHGLQRSKLISAINPENSDFIEQDRSSVKKLNEIIKLGQEKGQITKNFSLDFLVNSFILMLRSVTMDWSRRDGSYDIVKKMDDFILIFIHACKN